MARAAQAGGARVTRKWEVFAGRNRFWCDGRLMSAPRPGVLLLTLALLCGTAALHFAFDCPFLAARVSPAVPAAGAALFLYTLAALLRTALSDPGVLPRAAPAEARGAEGAGGAAGGEVRPPPRAREVLVRGRPVKLKYCFTCKMFRPPRASHCSLCDNCVERFDHHCPWVGNCVGRRNYRYFYSFVVSLAFLAVFVFACAVAHLALLARAEPGAGGAGLGAALRASPASAVVAAVCFLSVWSVLGLAGFHTYLASTDQTTNEDIKGSFSARRGGAGAGGASGANPYSRGNACANCWHVLCGPAPPSLIDRRGVLRADAAERDAPDELPAALRAQLQLQQPAPAPHAPYTLSAAPLDGALYRNGALGGSYTNLFESAASHARLAPRAGHAPHARYAPHAYMNHSLDLDPAPLHEVCVDGPRAGGAGAAGGQGALSASRLRLLHDTTMIDAALDLDEPEPPRHLPPAPAPAPAP